MITIDINQFNDLVIEAGIAAAESGADRELDFDLEAWEILWIERMLGDEFEVVDVPDYDEGYEDD